MESGYGEGLDGKRISLLREFENVFGGYRIEAYAAHFATDDAPGQKFGNSPANPRGGDIGLDASRSSAAALPAARRDDDVSELAAMTVLPDQEPSVNEYPGPQAGSQRQLYKVVHAPCGAIPSLAKGCGVAIVHEADRNIDNA